MFYPSVRWNYERIKETAKELGVRVPETDDWLFNSLREYTVQINHYKAHKGLIEV